MSDPDDEPTGRPTQVAAYKRAIESIVLVAHDPVPPELLAQLLEQPTASIERWCEELAAEYRSRSAASSWPASPAATATRPPPT